MTPTRRAFVVADLAFGDAGKGTIVDWLVREHDATLVVRWNGGAQAGHTVVLDDGRHHTFAQLGAGTFVPGVRTHLAEPVVIHPTGLLVEARRLAAIGVTDALARLTIAESSRVITPYHQAANRLRELARGAARHGTCGVGVGETVRDALAHPDDVLRARDLVGDRGALRAKLARIQERIRVSIGDTAADPRERAVLDDTGIDTRWIAAIAPLGEVVVPDATLTTMLDEATVVLEGAQGVLLDEQRGFHPHTTWSPCTTTAAQELLTTHGWREAVTRIGVLRTYLTRHGEGPFPTEQPGLDLPEPHNASAGWQGAFRRGWPDLVLARYACAMSGGVDALAITHLDRLANIPKAAFTYDWRDDDDLVSRDATGAIALRAGDLAHQARLARGLARAIPVYEAIPQHTEAYLEWIAAALAVPVGITSAGPTTGAKHGRGGIMNCR
ncbi:MAG: adenylosuccinate synthetase [Deltaproteobacteria bacterium]|nr:adenylosuccinate synthetase [Deltaproteobacteria bacterium]